MALLACHKSMWDVHDKEMNEDTYSKIVYYLRDVWNFSFKSLSFVSKMRETSVSLFSSSQICLIVFLDILNIHPNYSSLHKFYCSRRQAENIHFWQKLHPRRDPQSASTFTQIQIEGIVFDQLERGITALGMDVLLTMSKYVWTD